jgi:hypothetical protein
MNEPRRLSQSGGVSQRLLDSASIDKPSVAARRRAELLAATASSFSTTSSSRISAVTVRPANVAKTLATWIVIGAAASGTLALLGSKLFDSPQQASANHGAAAPMLAELPAAPSAAPAHSPDIAAEPNAAAVKVPTIAATPPAPSAAADETREIEAARAAIARGDLSGAIATLDSYDRAHPSGQLKPESMALRIQALTKNGNVAEARKLANDFQSKYPGQALLNQLRNGRQ